MLWERTHLISAACLSYESWCEATGSDKISMVISVDVVLAPWYCLIVFLKPSVRFIKQIIEYL